MRICIGILLTLLCLAFCMTGCEKTTSPKPDDVVVIPTNPYYVSPVEADWKITISQSIPAEGEIPESSTIRADYIKDNTVEFDASDSAVLIVNDFPVTLTAAPILPGTDVSHFYGSVHLNPGSTYNIGFKFNGKLKMTTDIVIPEPAAVIYPTAFDLHSINMMQWSVPDNSQYQFVELASFDPWLDGGDSTIDRYRVKLDASFRTYTFPADIVIPSNNEIAQTGYTMAVNQLSAKIVNRVFLFVGQFSSKQYYLFNDNHIPIDPEVFTNTYADWVVAMSQVTAKHNRIQVNILAKCLQTVNLPTPADSITLNVGTSHVHLSPLNNIYFYGSIDLDPGDNPVLVLKNNDTVLAVQSVQIPYPATVEFPADYTPDQFVDLNWTLTSDNHYQFLEVEAFKDDGSGGQTSDYFRQLSGGTRYFYIPQGAVQNFGTGTEYSITLKQLNYYVLNRVILMLMNASDISYFTKGHTDPPHQTEDLDKLIRKMGIRN